MPTEGLTSMHLSHSPIPPILRHHSNRSRLLNKAPPNFFELALRTLAQKGSIFSRQEFQEFTQEINLLLTFDPHTPFTLLWPTLRSEVLYFSEFVATIVRLEYVQILMLQCLGNDKRGQQAYIKSTIVLFMVLLCTEYNLSLAVSLLYCKVGGKFSITCSLWPRSHLHISHLFTGHWIKKKENKEAQRTKRQSLVTACSHGLSKSRFLGISIVTFQHVRCHVHKLYMKRLNSVN